MDRILLSKEISPQTIAGIGIAVQRNGLHVGIFYKVAEGQPVKLLHLAWHHRLKSDVVSSDYVCWVRPSIGEERAMAVASFCRRIWDRNKDGKVPFSYSRPGRFFDLPSGKQIGGPAKIGLTCASFVLTVFEDAGLPLVRYDTWPEPSPEDIQKQQEHLRFLKERTPAVDAEHLKNYASEIGNVRYRPLEVAGAGAADQLPTDHDYASQAACYILNLLEDFDPQDIT